MRPLNVRVQRMSGCWHQFHLYDARERKGHTLFFTNTSGKNWTSLSLIETGVPAADISCTQSLFLSCTTETLKNGSVEILLSGVRERTQSA